MGENQVDVYKHRYPTAAIVHYSKVTDEPHGTEGHVGYKCGACGRNSENPIVINDHSIDRFQNILLDWQEECDGLMSEFDKKVAAHFPVHREKDPLCDCPQVPRLPDKPKPQYERALT